MKNIHQVLENVPEDKLLIETDLGSTIHVDHSLLEICKFVSIVKGWSLEKTAQTTFQNSSFFFGLEN